MSNHTPDGTYKVADLLTPEMRAMTLEQILLLLIYKIVQNPDTIEVVFASLPRRKILDVDIHPKDRRFVIGRSGYIIQALRTIAKAILGPDCKDYIYTIEVTPDSISTTTNS